jgi:hypothetical protein
VENFLANLWPFFDVIRREREALENLSVLLFKD